MIHVGRSKFQEYTNYLIVIIQIIEYNFLNILFHVLWQCHLLF